MVEKDSYQIQELGATLLEIGAMLMSNGANSLRIRAIIERISEAFGYNIELLITNRALMLSIIDDANNHLFSSLKRTSPHGVNFRIVSGISRMSWRAVDEKWTVSQIDQELERLRALPHYPRWIILLIVGVAGASLCRLFGGNWQDMAVAFAATMVGLFTRQEAIKRRFNPYLSIAFAALMASLISGLYLKFGVSPTREQAFTTAVLFLVPGVPLINSFSDFIDGNIMNGLVRGMNGLIIAFAIALGLLSAMLIFHI
jgi:uncharacterized membrane protein YjjP (DUF1212 family)